MTQRMPWPAFALEAQRRLQALRRDVSGLSAVEFALLLPIMITMYVGAVEFSHALTIDRRVTSVASTAADLVAQVENITPTEIDDVFDASTSIMLPYNASTISIVLTSVVADASNVTTVGWSCARNGSAHSQGSSITLPTGLTQALSSVIMAEVSYTYTAPVGQFLTGGINLTETFYLRPRRSLTVALSATC